jgi:hypothetical protein
MLEKEVFKEEKFLLDSGRRFRKLDFYKAPWPEIKTRLRQLDWEPLEVNAKENVIAAHKFFMETILPILEDLVPKKMVGKRFGHSKKTHKRRTSLWRKLSRIRKKLHSTSSVTRATALLQQQMALELELKARYNTQS